MAITQPKRIMKKLIYIAGILVASMGAFTVAAQEETEDIHQQQIDPKARQKVEAARIALITERLGLTPEQAEKFWPVYREFIQKRLELRKEFRDRQRAIDPNNPDPQKEQDLLNFGLQVKQRELDLEKDYSGRIMKVISAQQLLNLRRAEQDFRQMILNQLQQRRALQQRKENFRDRNQRLKQNRN